MREKLWFGLALALNIILLLFALAVLVPLGLALSVFYALIALCGLLLLLVARAFCKRQLFPLHAGAMVVFILSLATVLFGWTGPYWWADLALHLLGGLFVALYFLVLSKGLFTGWKLFAWSVALAVTVGVVWEWAELAAWFFRNDPIFLIDAFDVLTDLMADALGAVVASALVILFSRR